MNWKIDSIKIYHTQWNEFNHLYFSSIFSFLSSEKFSQDIVATIWDNAKQDSTDQYFTLGGTSTYADIHSGLGRGWERNEWYEVNCEARPTCVSSSKGDPHFTTWKQEHFEFHGQCDMILAKDSDFANGIGLDVQIRTKLVRFWSYIHTAVM